MTQHSRNRPQPTTSRRQPPEDLPAPRARLNRAAVVEAGIGVVDDGGARGFERLTLAEVAANVGVAVPSLYKHVRSLADLRRAIAVTCMNELTATLGGSAVGRSGSDALHKMAVAYRDYARLRPGRYFATQLAPRNVPGAPASPGVDSAVARAAAPALAAEESERDTELEQDSELHNAAAATVAVVAAVLAGCEVAPDRTVDAIRAIRSGLHGFVSLELNGGFGLSDDVDQSFDFLVRTLDAGVRAHAARRT